MRFNLSNFWVIFHEYVPKITLTRNIFSAQNVPNTFLRPGGAVPAWELRLSSWIMGSLLVRERVSEGNRGRGRKGRRGDGREGKGTGW